MEAVSALFPFAIILAAFYLLIIRPARTRQRTALRLQQQLAPGLEVMTTSGMFGRITAVADDAITVEVAPGVTIRFAKAAVGRVLTDREGTDGTEGTDGAASTGGAEPSAAEGTNDRSDDRSGDQPSR